MAEERNNRNQDQSGENMNETEGLNDSQTTGRKDNQNNSQRGKNAQESDVMGEDES